VKLSRAEAEKLALVVELAATIEDRAPKEQAALLWLARKVDDARNTPSYANLRANGMVGCCDGTDWRVVVAEALDRADEPRKSGHVDCENCGGRPIVAWPPSRLEGMVG